MKKGFTLAETLLTLVILGGVAAMTLPSVFSNTREAEWEAQRLKAISTVSNGYKKMLSVHGLTSIDNLPMWSCTTQECFSNEHKLVFNIIADSLSDNILNAYNPEPLYGAAYALTFDQNYKVQGSSSDLEVSWGDLDYVFVTTDGMIFGLTNLDTENNLYFDVLVDTNGGRNPNKVGKDYFEIQLDSEGEVIDVTDDAVEYVNGDTSDDSNEEVNDNSSNNNNNYYNKNNKKKNRNKNKNRGRNKGHNNGNNNGGDHGGGFGGDHGGGFGGGH